MALTLALAVNELGTNSVKYGALSNDVGTVEITWSLRPGAEGRGRELVWTWVERGGPPVSPPSRRGFGRFLIERVLAADFEGTVKLEYASAGLVCALVAPAPEDRAS
ncbi:MAG: sensor histidine kinase [Hyphomicrobiales bacterium]|nr:MAG: sensor histidine kinase [Hyphomicrobiales bacterium]